MSRGPARRRSRRCFIVGQDDPRELSASDRAEVEAFSAAVCAKASGLSAEAAYELVYGEEAPKAEGDA